MRACSVKRDTFCSLHLFFFLCFSLMTTLRCYLYARIAKKKETQVTCRRDNSRRARKDTLLFYLSLPIDLQMRPK